MRYREVSFDLPAHGIASLPELLFRTLCWDANLVLQEVAQAEVQIITEVGHFPHVEAAAEVAEMIARFVSDVAVTDLG